MQVSHAYPVFGHVLSLLLRQAVADTPPPNTATGQGNGKVVKVMVTADTLADSFNVICSKSPHTTRVWTNMPVYWKSPIRTAVG